MKGLKTFKTIIRNSSTKISATNDYIKTWLGSDLKGDAYPRQLMNNNNALSSSSSSSFSSSSSSIQLYVKSIQIQDWNASYNEILNQIELENQIQNQENNNNIVLIDFSNVPKDKTLDINIDNLINDMQKLGLNPIGAINTDNLNIDTELSIPYIDIPSQPSKEQLSISMNTGRKMVKDMIRKHASSTSSSLKENNNNNNKITTVHHGTVRSGQQIYAENSSLIVIGTVNEGAELLSDGDIHVYGRLYGRAIAGLSGNEKSYIFATHFQPSLVGIADTFAMVDDISDASHTIGRSVSVSLVKPSTFNPSTTGILKVDDEDNQSEDKNLYVSILE